MTELGHGLKVFGVEVSQLGEHSAEQGPYLGHFRVELSIASQVDGVHLRLMGSLENLVPLLKVCREFVAAQVEHRERSQSSEFFECSIWQQVVS